MSRSPFLSTIVLGLALCGCGAASKPTATHSQKIILEPGSPVEIETEAPAAVVRAGTQRLAEFKLGRAVAAQSGCLACHRIGNAGNSGPGPNLTHVGSMLSSAHIERAILAPTDPMPSFRHLPTAKLHALVVFLSLLRR